MSVTLPIAHDFICPWCWVGLLQALKLKKEFGVALEWKGYELWPEELAWPVPSAATATAPEPSPPKPPVPSRFDFILFADGIKMPTATRPKGMRTHNAHEAVEFAKSVEKADEMVEALYRAYWERGLEINSLEVIESIANGIVPNPQTLRAAIEARIFKNQIVGFDDPAYTTGIYNVPTFYIGGQPLAEQPYSVLQKALSAITDPVAETDIYRDLAFPPAPKDRPYFFLNMVTTIDGKILSGSREEGVHDLGSRKDHELMKRIEASADAVIVGAQTLRSTSKEWNPKARIRIVVTSSGKLPYDSKFFTEGEAYIATSESAHLDVPEGIKVIRSGKDSLDIKALLMQLRQTMGVSRLVGMGGSELNAQFLKDDLVDELFWTVAPKVKLGRDIPTYADGDPLDRLSILPFFIVEQYVVNNEIFVRYRRESRVVG